MNPTLTGTSLAGRTIVVLSGGTSSEREVSLATGKELVKTLRETELAQLELESVEITATGQWSFRGENGDPQTVLAGLPEHAVFLLGLHGGGGENGAIQGLLESAGRIYTGSGVVSSALCMNKYAAREVARSKGVRLAPAELITQPEWEADANACLARCEALDHESWFVKPNEGGSSVATTHAQNREELEAGIRAALDTGDRALVESAVSGVECSCGVLGNADVALRALPPIEIQPHEGRFFDYTEKYSESGAREVCPAESLDEATRRRVEELAVLVHDVFRCDGYSRSDFIVPGDGEPVFLETNTLPGFTSRSLLPQEAQVVGIDFDALVLEILDLAIQRFESAGGRA